MSSKDPEKRPPLEEGLLKAMSAIDRQIAREMQRDPEELKEHGVGKWEPFVKRIEKISTLVLTSIGETEIGLDSLLVMAQAMTKSLYMLVSEMEEEGLGKVRSEYCLNALSNMERDLHYASLALSRDNKTHNLQ